MHLRPEAQGQGLVVQAPVNHRKYCLRWLPGDLSSLTKAGPSPIIWQVSGALPHRILDSSVDEGCCPGKGRARLSHACIGIEQAYHFNSVERI